jgi:ElaB/YqjD/DUF883 family membrane-anchored ribosome-binding protein
MERNANDTFGNQNVGDASSGAGVGGTSGTTGAGYGGTSDASFSRDTATDAGNLTDRAKSALGTAGERLSDAGSTMRDKAGSLKTSLADALESGAERLRQQGAGGGQLAGAAATGGAEAMVTSETNRMADVSNQVAGGLQASADWLRDADLDGLKSGLERQVKEHPGRTLAVAVGLGYLLGKAIRK